MVLARSFARIHWHNLVNFGILPLTFADSAEYERIQQEDRLQFTGLRTLQPGRPILVKNHSQGRSFQARHALSARQIDVLNAGGLIAWMRRQL